MTDWEALRAEFPALERWTYLNTASFGQVPRRAYQAVARHFAHRDELACADFLDWFDDADLIRSNLAQLLGCTAADVAFLPTASMAMSLLLQGIDWQPGDRVLTLEGEFPNNLYGPAVLDSRGVIYDVVPWERFHESLDDRTRLVVLSGMNYSTGFRAPVEEIGRELRRRGVLFYLDGTQGVGAFRMNVAKIAPAMLAVDAYKWMLTPNGAGFAYVHPDVRRWLPPAVIGWRSHYDWRSVDHLHQGVPVFKDSAERYEGGTLPFPGLYALDEVTRMMLAIGPEQIEARVLDLAARTADLLRSLGAQVLHERSPIIAARFGGRDASDMARHLHERGILVSARHGNLRISVHFYNNVSDLERLGEGLTKALAEPR